MLTEVQQKRLEAAKRQAALIPAQGIKVKVQGRFRRGRITGIGRNRQTKEIMVRVMVDYMDMPWSSPFPQVDWYPVTLLRKQDRELLETLRQSQL